MPTLSRLAQSKRQILSRKQRSTGAPSAGSRSTKGRILGDGMAATFNLSPQALRVPLSRKFRRRPSVSLTRSILRTRIFSRPLRELLNCGWYELAINQGSSMVATQLCLPSISLTACGTHVCARDGRLFNGSFGAAGWIDTVLFRSAPCRSCPARPGVGRLVGRVVAREGASVLLQKLDAAPEVLL